MRDGATLVTAMFRLARPMVRAAPLVVEIVKFFQTRKSPVPAAETLELFAFMEAADESKRQGGAPVKIKDVIKKAKAR